MLPPCQQLKFARGRLISAKYVRPYALHIRWVVAAAGTITVGHAAFDAAIAAYPNEHFTLRNRALVIREHVPKGP